MIKTIRIQNFRSLQDVTLDLQDVNLLIGPNNSGKSNLLKAFEFLGDFFNGGLKLDPDNFKRYFFLQKINLDNEMLFELPMGFTLVDGIYIYKIEIFGIDIDKLIVRQLIGTLKNKNNVLLFNSIDLNNVEELEKIFEKFEYRNENVSKNIYLNVSLIKDWHTIDNFNFQISFNPQLAIESRVSQIPSTANYAFNVKQVVHSALIRKFAKDINGIKAYSVNISNLKKPYPTLEDDYSVKPDASNLVAFLDNMRDNKPDIMEAINSSLNECIKEFKSISFEKVKLPKDHDLVKIHGNKTFKRLGVRDKYGQIYWADELSDGTLYFLALLAIIHQPNPPKLLMIEEPENGIHPRRIKELIDYFFEIADKQGVQVIMTTHSTVVIDQFTDLPESIFIFDKKEQATTVRNLKTDVIAEDEKQSEKLNVPKLDLSQSLGDHWASGLIGGVPK